MGRYKNVTYSPYQTDPKNSTDSLWKHPTSQESQQSSERGSSLLRSWFDGRKGGGRYLIPAREREGIDVFDALVSTTL